MSYKSLSLIALTIYGCHSHAPIVQVIDPVVNPNYLVMLKDSIFMEGLEGGVYIEYEISKEARVMDFHVVRYSLKNDSLNLRVSYDADSIYTHKQRYIIDSISHLILDQIRNFEVRHSGTSMDDCPATVGMMYRVYRRGR